jgi:hypothetical protein
VLELLGDEYVREIIVATYETPRSAKELCAELDAARSTIYDRAEAMVEQQLLVEHTRIMDDGSHHSVYEATVDHLDIDISDGEFEIRIETYESAAERFTNIWGGLREV